MQPLSRFLCFGLVAALVAWVGCSKPSNSVTRSKNPDGNGSGSELLDAAVNMMQPERLGINARAEQAAGLLNQWRATRLEIQGTERLSEPLSETSREFLEAGLSEDAIERVLRDDFTTEDAKHVRTGRLMKAIVEHAVKGVDGELNRAEVLFEYVARNVQLVSDAKALPLMPYEILVFGEGTAADRAWVFAELLRQLRQDAVIVKAASSDPAAPWFVAVVVDRELRLFDPQRSAAVPSANPDDPLPAGLADLSQPSVWKALTGEAEIPLPADAWQTIHVELIGTSALWSPRHAKLESVLTGADSVVISQRLTGEPGDSSAILNRMAQLEAADEREIEAGIWNHPQERVAAYQESESLDEAWKPFQAPLQIAEDPETDETIIGNPTWRLLKTRTDQLMGQYMKAIQSYSGIRLKHRRIPSQVPIDVLRMHSDAAEDAFCWAGVCQMEQRKPVDAARKFGGYIEETEKFVNNRHLDHARVLRGRCLAQIGEITQAIEAIAPLESESPAYETARFLKRQWEKIPTEEPSEPENEKPSGTTSSKPAIAEKADS